MQIRVYEEKDECAWLRCRVLAFLETAYYDNVLQKKEKYENPSLELVAFEHDQLIALLDLEYDTEDKKICSEVEGLSAMIWHVAVHPDYQRQGIAEQLLKEAETYLISRNIRQLLAYTRDDEHVNRWYQKQGFKLLSSYYHVYFDGGEELKDKIASQQKDLYVVQAFTHYLGKDIETLKSSVHRIHECILYHKKLEIDK